jgi:hypothetical protein
VYLCRKDKKLYLSSGYLLCSTGQTGATGLSALCDGAMIRQMILQQIKNQALFKYVLAGFMVCLRRQHAPYGMDKTANSSIGRRSIMKL